MFSSRVTRSNRRSLPHIFNVAANMKSLFSFVALSAVASQASAHCEIFARLVSMIV